MSPTNPYNNKTPRDVSTLHPQIDRVATHARFGYFPEQLSHSSGKPVVWRCAGEKCLQPIWESRERSLKSVPMFCRSCTNKRQRSPLIEHNNRSKANGLTPNGIPLGQNHDKYRKTNAEWRRRKRLTPQGRLENILRVALKRIQNGLTTKHLAYTTAELETHILNRLEAKDAKCPMCRTDMTVHTCDIEHRIPLSRARSEGQALVLFDLANLDVMCSGCNQFVKSDRLLDYWTKPRTTVDYSDWESFQRAQVLPEMIELIKRFKAAINTVNAPAIKKERAARRSVSITLAGETRTLNGWTSDVRCPISYPTAYQRINRGILPENALEVHLWLPGFEPPHVEPVEEEVQVPFQRPSGSSTPTFTHDGFTGTLTEWSERSGVAKSTIDRRLREGLSFAEATIQGRVKIHERKETAVGRGGLTREIATALRQGYKNGLRGVALRDPLGVTESQAADILNNRTWKDDTMWWRQ